MKRTDKRFETACINVAALCFSTYRERGYETPGDLWLALPESTKGKIVAFVLLDLEPPKKLDAPAAT